MPVAADPLIRDVLWDESLTRGLGDEEARMLVEWVVDWAELLAEAARTHTDASNLVTRLRRRARAIGRFVLLWCEQRAHGAAVQLAGVERFAWPLPTDPEMDAADLMQAILAWENQHPPG